MGGTYLLINKTTGELDHKQQNDTADAVYESPDTYADWKSKKKMVTRILHLDTGCLLIP